VALEVGVHIVGRQEREDRQPCRGDAEREPHALERTNDRIGNAPSSRMRHTVSSPRRTERNALSSVRTASERTMSRAMAVMS
jgi:hypothetical protein